MKQPLRFLMLSLSVTSAASSCGKKKKDGDAVTANLNLSNGTNLGLTSSVTCPSTSGYNSNTSCYTPTEYGVKIISAIVSPDASGATTGPAGLIWLNPSCSATTQTSDIDKKTYSYDSIDSDSCDDSKISTYFDFARDSATVNADLNSQKHNILPGTYNYVQLSFCIGGARSKNIEFKAEGMTSAHQVLQNSCGVASVKATTPIEVAAGDNVTISVAYDLKGVIVDPVSGGGTADTTTCYAVDNVTRCIGPSISLVPSFSKN